MQSFKAIAANSDMYCHSPFYLRADESIRNQTRFADLGELEQSAAGFHHDTNAVDLSRSNTPPPPLSLSYPFFCLQQPLILITQSILFGFFFFCRLHLQQPAFRRPPCGAGTAGTEVDTGQQYMLHKGTTVVMGGGSMGNGNFENWGDSAVAENSQRTDSSTDVDTDDKNQSHGVQDGALVVVDSTDQSKGGTGDQKVVDYIILFCFLLSLQQTLRRLAQNREAARKSRLRKKAYVQQLENSRLKLTQLEQELQRARQQGIFIATGSSGDQSLSIGSNGALAFDIDYARWLDEHQRLINDLRSAVNSHMGDNDLRVLVDAVMSHYDEIFRLKGVGAKSMFSTCFLQSSQQAEDALSQGMEALQQSLVETLSSNCLGPTGSGNVADYMGQMAIAMGKLATLENFLHQADLLRQQTLQQMHRILTTRQAARALLVISDYMSRLRALSSLWLARPKD
ncbi:hypothetical protein C3L33_17058, partial [Rhododendron williamsianum]